MSKWYDKYTENNELFNKLVKAGCIVANDAETVNNMYKYAKNNDLLLPSLPRSSFTENQDNVRKNFVGTLEEINKALEEAKVKDEAAYKNQKELERKSEADWRKINLYYYARSFNKLNEKQFTRIVETCRYDFTDWQNDDLYDLYYLYLDMLDLRSSD